MKAFLKLIRFQNLAMIALMQIIFRYGFLELKSTPLALNDWQYALLILATIAIAGGGYLINNIFDQETDEINKPQDVVVGKTISETTAYNIYVALNIIGVGIGFYLSNFIGKPGFSALFILTSGTLYLYASSLKQTLLIGNIIVAIITSLSIIIIGIFDLFPIITPENSALMAVTFEVLLDYALFCFIINFIRELVKDLEDVDGDYNLGMRTLPIILGVSRTVKVLLILSLIPIIYITYYINEYYISNDLFITAGYCLFLIIAPLLYFSIKLWSAKKQKDFNHLSMVLKLVLLFGIISILVLSLNIAYNA